MADQIFLPRGKVQFYGQLRRYGFYQTSRKSIYKSFLSNLSFGTTAEWHTTFRNISLSILFKNISHLNLKYFIASEILHRVFFILLMCQLNFLFAVFFSLVSDISFNYYYLRRGWIWHYSIKRQEILRCQSQIFYLDNHSFGSWVITLIYKHLFTNFLW